ncbi:amino acid ABC transporter permease [Castellaniella sp. MT123]|uniref:amino acid ABC transporter permease n=1 Tax=Castellaniella sp. MT123 TaxID=3140381 RepID=UPI0031F3E31F|nr:amino acid ABC transporter permease [Castellaniella sp.]
MLVDLDAIRESLPILLSGLKITALVSVIGIPTGIFIGALLAYAAESRVSFLRLFSKSYVEVVRNIPFLIIVYLSYFGLPKIGVVMSDLHVGLITVAFYTGGYFCEVMRAALHSVPKGQTQASVSLGMRPLAVQWHIVIPQLLSFLLPPTTSLVIMMFKETSILSVVALKELTYQSNLLSSTTFAYVEVFGMAALLYWLCSLVLDVTGNHLERHVEKWSMK